jgi:hypothetical protein
MVNKITYVSGAKIMIFSTKQKKEWKDERMMRERVAIL